MGQKHNSHIVNHTDTEVKVVLTDANDRNTTQILEPRGCGNDVVCIPTVQGSVTASVFLKEDGQYQQYSSASYTNDSDRSFIIKRAGNGINIVRSKYNHIHEEDTGLQ